MRHLRILLLCLLAFLTPALAACGDEADDDGGGVAAGADDGDGAATGDGDQGGDGSGDDDALGDGDPHNPDNYAVYETLDVDPGGEDVVREGGVVRAEKRDAYVVVPSEFGTGQQLNVRVSSLEDNASFFVYGPDGSELASDVKEASIDLTEGGPHVIEIGPTRGNTSYTVRVNISVKAD